MIGALKCSGSGVRMFRNIAPVNNNSIPTSSLDSSYVAVCGDKRCCAINWSQKRFLRCLSPSSTGSTEGGANVNGQFTVNEIENRHKRSIQSLMSGNRFPSDKRNGQKENYRKSIKGHQSYILRSLPNASANSKPDNDFVAEMYKIIIENGSPAVRVKSRKDDILVKEWIGIQNELHTIKKDRIEEDKRKLQIAGQQALREMEASLRKGMNLEDLDEAIEGALCSELKDQ